MAEWYMIGDGVTANYGLYQTVTLGFVNGFILCPESNNEYYQVFYNEYLSEPPAYPGCEFVGLQVGFIYGEENEHEKLMSLGYGCSVPFPEWTRWWDWSVRIDRSIRCGNECYEISPPRV